ncbi:hypothetical protein RIF29_27536 [Crotalaria pallida]|uniref:Flavin-containing monooxygenase n=1 Tax=Crotalaria pallida TaxID=3830 RepID=A0AAN9EPY0_CROPI
MEKSVAIIGAGLCGLISCKYLQEKGFNPIVFEAEDGIGGVWRHTIASTKLQNHRKSWEFSDFPWHPSVKEDNPNYQQVLDYLNSYAEHFDIIPCIRFNSKVIDIDYVGESIEEMKSWELWGGNGLPFGSKGKWHITVQDTNNLSTEVYEVKFVILCLGKFSGVPYIPEFPPGQGPELFKGKVMHSMEYSAMDKESAAALIKSNKVTIVGSRKSALDTAVECANANVNHPCTMIQRSTHWHLPDHTAWGINLGFLFSRFAEFIILNPGEPFLRSLAFTLLSPLRWGLSKLVESSLRWKLPMKKFGLIPSHSFLQDLSTCSSVMLPQKFYDKLTEGSIIIKKSESIGFCKEGLIIKGEDKPIETDLVILATGFKGEQKLKSIFKSTIFQKDIINGSLNSSISLYRQIIHPRIPQLGIIGYTEDVSNIFAAEMRCQWLAHFLDGRIGLPNIIEMEKDAKGWENRMKLKSCIAGNSIWYNDQFCKDMGCNPRRKNGLFAELFEPYGPADYVGLTRK